MNQCLALIGKEVAIDECRDDVVALCLEGCRHDPEKEGEMYTAGVQVCAGEFEGRGLGAVPGTG
jgi:hypothetical protein